MKDKSSNNYYKSVLDARNSQIVLLGMMGTGKTTLGRKLAKNLEIEFFDIDLEVEGDIGHSISWIFENIGEKEFRKMEHQKIKSLLENKKPKVIALGGGAFLNEDSRKIIKENAVSVWLKASAETIFRRVSARKDRPLLETEDDKLALVKKIMKDREEVYSKADLITITDNTSQKKVLEKIITEIAIFINKKKINNAN
ncbi:MAG: shikimate kinase [Rickettsiales bacterium]|nr:shikimate kinase [Rickettsiales bacterium]